MSAKAEYKREYYQKNKEKIKARVNAYRESHKEVINAKKSAYRESHKEEIKAYASAYAKSQGAIKSKLSRHMREDEAKGREFNLTYEYVIGMLDGQNGVCARCDVIVKKSWTEAYDSQQFSINRLDNKLGHIEGNVEICCLQCNREYH
jgi:hypothetical protein